MAFLTDKDWLEYVEVINEFAQDASQESIIWHRSKGGLDRFQEDNKTERYDTIELKGLILYNVFRTWPIDRDSESGMLDNQNCMVFLTNKVLEDLGYLNTAGYFDFKHDTDWFEIAGIRYRPAGDTQAAQAKPLVEQKYPLMTCVILTRHQVDR